MDMKLELVAVPVSDVDRAKAFYVDHVGFVADTDTTVNEDIRFVQLTPPGSACSIAFGRGIVDSVPGSLKGLQIVVADAAAARDELAGRGGRSVGRAGLSVGPFRLLLRSRRQRLVVAAAPGAMRSRPGDTLVLQAKETA
jgi:catechol 2,3-dioxygenase-like lactoylglutathione lyase family enzyme